MPRLSKFILLVALFALVVTTPSQAAQQLAESTDGLEASSEPDITPPSFVPSELHSADVKTVQLSNIPKFVPAHIGGDTEFDGHGPNAYASVRLEVRNGQLWARVYMTAKETKSDYTEVSGSNDYVVYDGERILSIAKDQDTYSDHSYTDNNHEDDVFDLPERELVRRFIFVGDTKGKEAGTRTGVTVSFNPVRVHVETTAP